MQIELIALQEILSKLRHIAVFAKNLNIAVSQPLKLLLRSANSLHPELQIKAIDIMSYRPTFTEMKQKNYPPELLMDAVGNWQTFEVSEQDSELQKSLANSAYIPRGARFYKEPAVHLFSDGGSQAGKGTAGFVILNNQA